jgi:hypothetical protein
VHEKPWAQRLYVPWETGVSFYQRRWDVLQRLEDEDLLYDHRVIEERVALRLGDAQHVSSFSDERRSRHADAPVS